MRSIFAIFRERQWNKEFVNNTHWSVKAPLFQIVIAILLFTFLQLPPLELCCLSCWFNEQRIFFLFFLVWQCRNNFITRARFQHDTHNEPRGVSIVIYGCQGINEYLWYWKLYRLLPFSFRLVSFNVLL